MGLLSGIGQVLAGGIAGGAKAAGESFVEQAKQAALEARETNMLRIQNLFAKEGRKETQDFQAGESKLGREATENLAKTRTTHELGMAGTRTTHELGMAETERQFRTDTQAETNRLNIELEKTKDADARERLKIQHGYAVKLQKLANDAPAATAKLDADLKSMGIPADKRMELIISGLSGEKQDKIAYVTMFSALLRTKTEAAKASGTIVTPAEIEATREEASLASGYVPKAKPGAAEKSKSETLVERAKRVKAEKEKAALLVPDVSPVPDVNPLPAKPGLLQPPPAAFEGPARDAALSQRNAAKLADYDRKYAELQRQGKSIAEIYRLIGKSPVLD